MENIFPELDDYWREPDFLLRDVVSFLANKMNSNLGVTLMVRGAIMTGTLVGEREYLSGVNDLFKRMARETIAKPSKEELESIDEAFNYDEMTEDLYPGDETLSDGDEAFEPQPVRYLHLRDPVIVHPNATMSFHESPLPIMRIRLTEVEGWMLGRIMVMSHNDMDEDAPLPRGGFIQ
jgi:hypothetical protein